nr:adenylate/guanylate cyclase domain-containing protein [Gordonia soli]
MVTLPVADRAWMARCATAAAGLAIVGSNGLVGLETFFLVQLAFNGGQLSFETTIGAPNFPAVVAAIVAGMIVNVVLGLYLLKPALRWFVSGAAADHEQRRAVQRIPIFQVCGSLAAWATALVTYAVTADDLASVTVAAVAGAFALAGISSACITYVFAERAARPLAVVALRDYPAQHVINGVHARMTAVWLVSSAVPMIGLLIMNIARWTGMLPPVRGPVDWTSMVLAIVSLAAGARVIALVGRAIADPLIDLRSAIRRVDDGDLAARVPVYDSSELGVLQHGFNEMVTGLEERERMRELFARHVGDTVAANALERGVGMHGAKTEVGVLFVDIVGSTTIAAQQDPQRTADLLNAFFTIVADAVDRHGGFVNKFEGDAALAVFGAPVEVERPGAAALAAARDLARSLDENLAISWGIGVSYGPVFAGDIGSERRYEYTVIGDPVNECARLSEMAKSNSVPVIASGAALTDAGDEAEEWRSIGSRRLRGRTENTDVFVPEELAQDARQPSLAAGLTGLLRPPHKVSASGLLRLPFTFLGR